MAYCARVQAIIGFIEKLTVPSGVGAGKPFKVRKWQARFINDVYGPRTKAGRRKVRRAILSIGRKNGKTALIACLVLVHLAGPEQIMNGEIYSAATEREQAAQVFNYAAQIVRADAELETMLKVVDSTKTIASYTNGSFYRALSAEAGSKMGKNPSFAIYDELAQAKNRALYDAIDTAFGGREEPLFIVISTQSPDPQHPLSLLIDDGLSGTDETIVCHLYAVPDDCEDIFSEEFWELANPALGDFRDLEDMRAMARKAKRMPSFESSFRNLNLNQRVDQKSPLIPRAEWVACNGDATIQPGESIYLGLDLSGTTDLCALSAVSAEKGDRVRPWFWKPQGLLKEHENRDRVPYPLWAKNGFLDAPPGRSVDYGYVVKALAQIHVTYNVLGLAFDRWRIEILLKEAAAIGLNAAIEGRDFKVGDPCPAGFLRLVPWGQGFKDMAAAVDALETSILERRFVQDGHPVLTWCFSNAMTISDPAGNRKLDKSKARFRIDGAVSTTMALGLKIRDMAKEPVKSAYEGMTAEQIAERMSL